jgi:hypothetical protein
MPDERSERAVELMTGFAARAPAQRYLWTDAFAVCNLLGLGRATGEMRYDELALRLVDRVHHALGRHRVDDPRSGWISGLDARDGEAHPTRGGLRIGKALPERGPAEPLDERLEWDRDGQYFHYLTKWMHALDQVARSTGQPVFNGWARELAHAAHRAFTYAPRGGGQRRMYWKMSIDLTRPLVTSMGHHDPLDGFVTCIQLDATAARLSPTATPSLGDAARDFATMIDRGGLATADPLGLGGLLVDAWRVAQLMQQGGITADQGLLAELIAAALAGLARYVAGPDLRAPADQRLGFRELGLAIGLAAASAMLEAARRAPGLLPAGADTRARLEQLAAYAPVRTTIESFWLDPEHRRARTWRDHLDINEVMLATSLRPEGFLVLRAA